MLLRIALETPYEEVDLTHFMGKDDNPFGRKSAHQKKIVASKMEFNNYDNHFTKTGDNPIITVKGLKDAKIINRGEDDKTLFTSEAQIYMTISYYVSWYQFE